jgi:hypothetical protein
VKFDHSEFELPILQIQRVQFIAAAVAQNHYAIIGGRAEPTSTGKGSRRAAFAAVSAQTETDEYTRYELLAPDTTSFTIRYEVTATTPGAKYNQLG